MREFVFTGWNTPTPSCHASTLAVLPDQTVVCAWFGGTHEGADDVQIWFSRREPYGWTRPVSVSPEDGPHWNPVLFPVRGGLRLFYKVGKPIAAWRTLTRFSADGGKTWDTPRELVPGDVGGRGPVKNKCLRLSDGAILAPASLEGLSPEPEWRAFFDRSEDEGETWVRTECLRADANLIQPTLWESAPGRVHALLRSDRGRVYRADSADGGRTWTEAYPTAIPNNNSGLDAVWQDGALYVVCNPVEVNWGIRSPLTLLRSRDNGVTFEPVAALENDPPHEFSYPGMVYADGALHICYTWRREQIAYLRLTL